MTSLPFQFLDSVLLWTSELAWACGHWHNNFNLCAFLGLSLPQSSLSRNIPGFCSCTKYDLTCHMAGNFGATTKLLYSICVYPILPLLGFFLTGSSFILSSFLALKAYLLSKVAMVQPATKAPWVRPSRSVWTKTLGSQHTSRAWTSALMMQVGIDL